MQTEKHTPTLMHSSPTGLTPIEKSAAANLPEGLRKYVTAKESPKVIGLDPIEAVHMLLDLIMATQVNIGHTKSAEDDTMNAMAAKSIYDLIVDRFKTITVSELKLAVLNGSLGEYGDYVGVNLKSVSGWIKSYSTSELKKKAMSEWNKLIDLVQITKFSEDQKVQIEIDGALNYFEEFKAAGLLNEIKRPVDKLASIFYDRLKAMGLIQFAKSRRERIYDESKTEYEEKLKSAVKDRTINFKMADMEKIMATPINDNLAFSNLCKRRALLEYFNDLLELGEELSDKIKLTN
jgi:hypothetical protein